MENRGKRNLKPNAPRAPGFKQKTAFSTEMWNKWLAEFNNDDAGDQRRAEGIAEFRQLFQKS